MRRILFAVLAVLIGIANVPTASALTVGFSPGPSFTTATGTTYNVDVVVSGLLSGKIVSAYNMDVLYDPLLLQPSATPVTFGIWLGSSTSFEVLEDVILKSGVINFASVSLLFDPDLQALQAPAGGTITLATLSFDAIADGAATLAFDWYPGRDIKGNNNEVIYPAGTPVPEPATLLLLGSGLAALLFLRRKR